MDTGQALTYPHWDLALRSIDHDDRLSIVEHLTELRTRLVLCGIVFAAVFGICIWQNDVALNIVNKPLERAMASETQGGGPLRATDRLQQQTKRLYDQLATVSRTAAASLKDPQLKREYSNLAREAQRTSASVPQATAKHPVTLGVGEPLTVTLQVAFYAALLLSAPLLLYQLYAFILPAFSRRERQVALPVMLSIPALFIAGAAFGYFVVLTRAIAFLQHFNNERFDILVQARDYYQFSIILLGAMGLLFQIPIAILALTRLGILSAKQLRSNRRYAILVVAIAAAFMPGPDPFSMLFAMVPLFLLVEGSILLASLLERRAAKASVDGQALGAAGNRGAPDLTL